MPKLISWDPLGVVHIWLHSIWTIFTLLSLLSRYLVLSIQFIVTKYFTPPPPLRPTVSHENAAWNQAIKLLFYSFQSVYLKPFAMACALMLFQQFSGINAVMFYLQNIFNAAGTEINPPGVDFINILRTNFSYERRFFYVHVTRENNICTKNLYV